MPRLALLALAFLPLAGCGGGTTTVVRTMTHPATAPAVSAPPPANIAACVRTGREQHLTSQNRADCERKERARPAERQQLAEEEARRREQQNREQQAQQSRRIEALESNQQAQHEAQERASEEERNREEDCRATGNSC